MRRGTPRWAHGGAAGGEVGGAAHRIAGTHGRAEPRRTRCTGWQATPLEGRGREVQGRVYGVHAEGAVTALSDKCEGQPGAACPPHPTPPPPHPAHTDIALRRPYFLPVLSLCRAAVNPHPLTHLLGCAAVSGTQADLCLKHPGKSLHTHPLICFRNFFPSPPTLFTLPYAPR